MCPSRTFVLGQLGQTGISFGDLEPIPPVPIQMTVVNKPSLKLFKFSAQLPANLGPLFGNCTLVLGVPAVRGPGGCKPRQTFFCAWAGRCPRAACTALQAALRPSDRVCSYASWYRTFYRAIRGQSAIYYPPRTYLLPS